MKLPFRFNGRKVSSAAMALLLCVSVSMALLPTAFATSTSDLESQKAALQQKLNSLSSDQSDAVEKVNLLTQKISVVTQQISESQAQIDSLNTQIAQTSDDLLSAQMEQENYYQLYCERVRSMEEDGSVSYWEILFEASSFSDLVDRFNLIGEIMEYDNSVMDQLQAIADEITAKQQQLEDEQNQAVAAAQELQSYQDELSSEESEAQQALDSIKSQISGVNGQISSLSSQISAAEAALAAQQAASKTVSTSAAAAASTAAATAYDDETSSDSGTTNYTYTGSGDGSSVIAIAEKYLGCRYVWASSGPSTFDCSGFTMYVFRQVGISLPHKASGQYGYGTHVSRSELQTGDLIFFSSSGSVSNITHVGIYIGNGQFIHASSGAGCITVNSLDSSYYSAHYVGATRIL